VRAMFARMNPRDRRALMLGALIAAPVLAYRAAVKPYLAALSDVREAVASERALLQREVTLLARAPKLPREIQSARLASSAADKRLFAGSDGIEATSALSSYVGNALRSSNVTVQQVESRDTEAAGAGLTEIALDVRAEGSLGAVLRALRGLESGPRLVRVTRVSVERSLASPAPGAAESLVIAATVRGYARLGGGR
jgi:type II secretory pathway component PulM